MNTQPIEKRSLVSTLQVHSIFETIQGEGPFAGVPAVFVRLAGCNLQCPMCDTDYTSSRKAMSYRDVYKAVRELSPSGLIVITGGEPFRQQILPLFDMFCDSGYFVQIETNGTMPATVYEYSYALDARTGVYIVVSPKTRRLSPSISFHAAAYKYVITAGNVDESDGLPVSVLGLASNERVARPTFCNRIYVQPSDLKNESENKANAKEAIASAMNFNYTLTVQMHKYLGLE